MTSVRQACHEDAWAIADLHVRTWRAAYRGLIPDDYLDSLSIEGRRQGWVETLRGDTTTVLVAEGSGLLEGFVAFGASRDHDTGGRVGEVYALYVQPGAWRSGAASALHDAAIQALAKADLIPATLWVLDSNAPARSFYAHRGWRPEGAVKLDHRPGATLREVRYRQDGTARHASEAG